MLVSFAVENFRSFREQQVLSMLAEDSEELIENTMATEAPALKGRRVLRAAGLYGANASGKSNFVEAFDCLARIVRLSAKESTAESPLPTIPFGLDQEWRTRPTRFSATFVIDDTVYIYDVGLTRRRIYTEELTAFPKTHPQRLFHRQVDDAGKSAWRFSRTHFLRDSDLENRTRPNSLYVSVGAHFNHPVLTKVSSFFSRADVRQPRYADVELDLAASRCNVDSEFKRWAIRLLASADIGIVDMRADPVEPHGRGPGGFRKLLPEGVGGASPDHVPGLPEVHVAHRGAGDEPFWWSIDRESDGTRQLLSLLRSWFDLLHRDVLVWVDELDDSLHPLISRRLLGLLGERESSRTRGQLIFTTHDTTLLDPTLLRRDQIFFTEKAGDGATKLYSLLEYAPRRDEALQKGYLAGRYGAIPFLGEFKFESSQRKAPASKKVAASSSDGG